MVSFDLKMDDGTSPSAFQKLSPFLTGVDVFFGISAFLKTFLMKRQIRLKRPRKLKFCTEILLIMLTRDKKDFYISTGYGQLTCHVVILYADNWKKIYQFK